MGCFLTVIFMSIIVAIIAIAGIVFPPLWLLIPIVLIVWAVRSSQKSRDRATVLQTRAIIEALHEKKD